MTEPKEKCTVCGRPATVTLNMVPYCAEHALERVEPPKKDHR